METKTKRFFNEQKYFNDFFKKNWYFEIDDYLLDKMFNCYFQSEVICRMISRITFNLRNDKEKFKEENIELMEKLFKVCKFEIKLKEVEKDYFVTIEGRDNYEGLFEKDFLSECFDLKDKKGLYFLYNDKKELIYIGKSFNLGSRIQESSKTRKARYFRYSLFENDSDLHILELYFINVFKPVKNTDSKGDKQPSFKIEYEITFEKDFIKVFKGSVNCE